MNEFIEKLIGMLEELYARNDKTKKMAYEEKDWEKFDLFTHRCEGIYSAIEIVNQLAEEYNNGWIPCSERLPENISTVLVQVEEFESPTIGWYGNIDGWRLLEKDFDELNDFTVIAWQPLPPAYQPKGGES